MPNKFHVLILSIIFLSISCNTSNNGALNLHEMKGKGLLLTTGFNSIEEFKEEVEIRYSKDRKSWVKLIQTSNGQQIISKLSSGIKESEIVEIRDGGLLGKIKLVFRSPYFVWNRYDILRFYMLSRRRHRIFGGGDVAFYDIAERMMNHINVMDKEETSNKDWSEKGYINTFNHANSQALATAIFSEELADFIADTHERSHMPELISGQFTKEQLEDIKNGAVDNYVDLINNEWGQEVGKLLKKKYNINSKTIWTPELLTNFINDLQGYYGWVFNISFDPFKAEDELMIKFSKKINQVQKSTDGLR